MNELKEKIKKLFDDLPEHATLDDYEQCCDEAQELVSEEMEATERKRLLEILTGTDDFLANSERYTSYTNHPLFKNNPAFEAYPYIIQKHMKSGTWRGYVGVPFTHWCYEKKSGDNEGGDFFFHVYTPYNGYDLREAGIFHGNEKWTWWFGFCFERNIVEQDVIRQVEQDCITIADKLYELDKKGKNNE